MTAVAACAYRHDYFVSFVYTITPKSPAQISNENIARITKERHPRNTMAAHYVVIGNESNAECKASRERITNEQYIFF